MADLTLMVGKIRGTFAYRCSLHVLIVASTGKQYRAGGGGYDKRGRVFADYLAVTYPSRLQALARKLSVDRTSRFEHLHSGIVLDHATGAVTVQGPVGFSSMIGLARLIGLTITECPPKRRPGNGGFLEFDVVDSWVASHPP
jgi:hypothetical protein